MIETLAAVMITALVITFAMTAYVQVSDTAEGATLRLRNDLHATTILDRIGADLESAILLVKPEETDPLRHPWYFVAESNGAFEGSDAIRFISRRTRSYARSEHNSDFAEVAYQIVSEEDGTQTLMRWLRPGLGNQYEPTFPPVDDERTYILGEGLSNFSFRFQNPDGEWVETWDSTQLVQSSQLPRLIEIRFDMGPRDIDSGEFATDTPDYVRRVLPAIAPINLDAMIVVAQEELAALGGAGLGESESDSESDKPIGDLLACIETWCSNEGYGQICATVAAQANQIPEATIRQYASVAGCQ